MGAPIIGSVISGIFSLASSLMGGGRGGGGGTQVLQPRGPKEPKGPPADLTKFQRPLQPMEAPAFLEMSGQMSPLQQRSQIATYGSSADDSRYRDPATLDYYRSLVLSDLVGSGGGVNPGAEPLPIERQFVTNLGQTPRADTTESFLSALLRA